MRSECSRHALGPVCDLWSAQTSSPPSAGASDAESPVLPVSVEVVEEVVSLITSGLHMKKGSAPLPAAKVVAGEAEARVGRTEYHCRMRMRVGRRVIDIPNPDNVLDTLRNAYAQTAVAPYPLRARPRKAD